MAPSLGSPPLILILAQVALFLAPGHQSLPVETNEKDAQQSEGSMTSMGESRIDQGALSMYDQDTLNTPSMDDKTILDQDSIVYNQLSPVNGPLTWRDYGKAGAVKRAEMGSSLPMATGWHRLAARHGPLPAGLRIKVVEGRAVPPQGQSRQRVQRPLAQALRDAMIQHQQIMSQPVEMYTDEDHESSLGWPLRFG